jgi:hypothetical protein
MKLGGSQRVMEKWLSRDISRRLSVSFRIDVGHLHGVTP